MTTDLEKLAAQLGNALLLRKLKITTAESCTGGGAAYWITRIPGSSEWFERGFVTYSIESKQEMLGIEPVLFQKYNVISETIVKAMADKAIEHSHAQVSISFTGIAGPTGGTSEYPIGTVWIGWAGPLFNTVAEKFLFEGSRTHIQEQAIEMGFKKLLDLLEKNNLK